MNVRSLAVVALMIPVVASAQRRVGGRVSTRPVPPNTMPPTAPVVAREMSYVPRPYSAEQYFFMNFTQQPNAVTGALFSSNALSSGTRIDYRLNPHFSLVGEATFPLFYGAVATQTFELGARVRPVPMSSESRSRPYFDARIAHVQSGESFASTDPGSVSPVLMNRVRWGMGTGAIAGMGYDFRINQTMWLTTGVWGMRSQLNTRTVFSVINGGNAENYWQTAYRVALGVRWNPMKAVATEFPR